MRTSGGEGEAGELTLAILLEDEFALLALVLVLSSPPVLAALERRLRQMSRPSSSCTYFALVLRSASMVREQREESPASGDVPWA
jgi:hypothetical protein